jgi:hypothetical protein
LSRICVEAILTTALMFSLVPAGEFIKFYELKEKDMLILYKDAEGKLVSYEAPSGCLLRPLMY